MTWKKVYLAVMLVAVLVMATSAVAQITYPAYGYISTIAGTGTQGNPTSEDSSPARSTAIIPFRVAVDKANNVYFIQKYWGVFKISAANGYMNYLANGYCGTVYPGTDFTGDGNTNPVSDIAFDANGNLFSTGETGTTVTKTSFNDGTCTIIAGNGDIDTQYSRSFTLGVGVAPTSTHLGTPSRLAVDSSGHVFISETSSNIIDEIRDDGLLWVIAGNGTYGYTGDDGSATSAEVALQPYGNAADVTAWGLDGNIAWPWYMFSSTGPATGAESSMATDSGGNLYFCDPKNHVVRKISTSGMISRFAGIGTAGFSGDGAAAAAAQLNIPVAIAIDSLDNVYISDSGNSRIRKVSSATGYISTIAGTGTAGYSGDGGSGTSAAIGFINGLATDSSNNIYLADTTYGVIRVIGGITPTNTTVSSNDSSVYKGATITLTATTNSTVGSSTPTGTVTFYTDSSSVGTCTLSSGSCTLSYSTSNLSIGSHSIYAVYGGGSSFQTSTSASTTQTITTIPTGITYSISPSTVYVTEPVNITGILTASDNSTPTGTLSFTADGSSIGTPSLTNGSASVSTSSLSIGTHLIGLSYPGTSTYASSSVSNSLTVSQITTTTGVSASSSTASYGTCVTFTATIAPAYGSASGPVSFADGSTSIGSATVSSNQASVQACSLSVGTHTITATYGGTTNIASSNGSVIFRVTQTTPTITWATPAAITYGTPLSSTQLNASTTVAGTFVYSPAAGTVLSAGTQTLSVTFTPTDTVNYTTASRTVSLTVNKATPAVTWATPAAITYGTPLSSTQLNASTTVAGTFVYSPSAGTVLSAGTQTLSVTFTPTDTTNYNSTSAMVSLTVNKATPTITWATPAAITYGTPLSSTQLNASTTVAGTFVYSPSAGVLSAGTHTLSVTFTPTDTTNYNNALATVSLTVNKATPAITWATPAAITYGTPLSSTQLNASTTVAGTFVYSPAAGTVLAAGTRTLTATFTPTDTTDYNSASATVSLTVNKATPAITWTTPAAITYGTPLSSTQLNASTTVAGTFVYSPAAGMVLAAGTQTLSVAFTPTDTTDYNSASATVSLTVNKAATTITGTSTLTPSIYGDSIRFTFVTSATGSGLTPTGTLTLTDGSTTLDTITLSGGSATYTTSALVAGSHTLVATYNGDSNYE